MWLAAIAFLGKILDLLNPWSSYWANKAKTNDDKKDFNRKNLNDATKKKGDDDAFLDAVNDSNNP